jgi:AcrR family transcriptional regulator
MRTGRPRSFERQAALEQAMIVFWEHGYDATSVTLLTAAMGIGAPSMYAAFGDKRALFDKALEHYLRTHGSFTTKALEDEAHARDAIARLLREAAIAYTSPAHPRGCLLITAATNCSPQSSDVKERLRKLRADGTRAVEKKLQTGIQAGELPRGTDAHTLASFYTATLQGMSARARDGANRADLDAIATTALSVLDQAESG